MCELAASRIPKVYSSTFFSHRNISIVDQQSRCFNLCWALHRMRRIRAEHHVAIVGGGVSGLTCAVALAAWTGCLVSIFECETTLLKRFRRAGHRYIHPDLNQTGGSDGHLIYDPHKESRFPFMNWCGNYAPAFAEELIRKFEHYRATLPIALHLNTTVGTPQAANQRVELPILKPTRQSMRFDAVILATGFGEEKLDEDAATNDISYWLSGNPLTYRSSPLRKGGTERVLVSGNGDSAIIEVAQLLIRDFTHENIFSFLPSNTLAQGLSTRYAMAIQDLAHRQIARHESMIQWYWRMRAFIEINPRANLFGSGRGDQPRRELYQIAHRLLRKFDQESDIEEPLLSSITETLQAQFDTLASREIKACLDSFVLSNIFSDKILGAFRTDLHVTVTGRSPTIYSTRQAPLNWFLLRVLMEYGAIQYHQTHLTGSRLVNNLTRCQFANPSLKGDFHRVITRHGPTYTGYASDPQMRRPTPLPSIWKFLPPPEFFEGKYDQKRFKNRRLLRAQRRPLPLDDVSYPGSWDSASTLWAHADQALWFCHGQPEAAKAEHLYRRLKGSRTPSTRRSISKRLLELAATAVRRQNRRRRSSAAG
ncbi:hypothetical protein GCM10011487_44960 [Steroidobacter agaridevorans]|uniref:Uncharacterized protein n=2 Tax=Steroidobacter agaridevorans TaxID=2695856 RepID=A0A829YJ02_9GAMM|nr:hypothetical protein GCM10011487_44960 [Steroidobacter agaridevorans]